MAEIKYINSQNQEINLSSYPIRLKQKDAGLYGYEWEPDITKNSIGARVNGFDKEPIKYDMTIDFSGAKKDRAKLLQEFYEIADFDVLNKKPGKLYVGNQYIECFVISSKAEYYEKKYRTIGKKCVLYVPYPFWMEEVIYTYAGKADMEEAASSSFLDYPYGYKYDYTERKTGTATLVNTHYVESSFKMIFYGPCVNPFVSIAGNLYKVNTTIDAGEYLTIDSKNNTVVRFKKNGLQINEFNNREKKISIFKKILPGEQEIVWPGNFGFDVILYQERSELKWT